MEGELEPEEEGKFLKPNLSRPINICPDSINLSRSFYTTSTVTSTTSSSSSSPPELVRLVHAAFKRNRPLGMIQPSKFKPKRNVPKREISNIKSNPAVDDKRGKDISQDDRFRSPFSQSKSVYSVTGEKQNQEDGTMTAPSEWGSTVNNTREENIEPYNSQRDQPGLPTMCSINNAVVSSCPESGNILTGIQKKVQFATNSSATSCGANYTMATRTDDLLSHMGSLALTEMEYDQGNQAETPSAMNDHWQHNNFQGMEIHSNLRSGEGISSLLAGRTDKDFGNFLRNDLIGAMTQSSVAGSSCVTSTLINPNSAPVVSSMTYPSQPQAIGGQTGSEPTGAAKPQTDDVQQSGSLSNHADGVVSHYSTVTSQAISSHNVMAKEPQGSLPNQFDMSKQSSLEDNNVCKGNVMNVTSQSSSVPMSDEKLENLKPERVQRGASGKAASTSRKRDYNPDLFFKVNEKMYQRLGKIGSGGSSEVHKVISSDCAIFALKKIRLKGRDYATAYGFCQEIEYLNKLKGKSNIIQLIDYEVTDKRLLQEVMNGSMSDKDGRIKDDQYIYMVLEYGEIDLAHMLAQKWKELDSSDTTIDENWLRFYWQQILQAVNTIHEERIVHSDLKPANFLLVRGSLKLIDFGIAKAIMNDTTNIQRDSQVGTLSYMSPEAFLCNETDANGNVIKCGRPSDIWSLGCILYQMVYGRTPFSEYKTFWAKFKVITDPNHEITYEPVSNLWLLDLMKKCLAWERNDRWRIPELLQHPFLVPPVPHQLPAPPEQSLEAFQHISELCANDQKSSMLCSQLQETLRNPEAVVETDSSVSKHLARKFLCKISNLCFQLQEQLAKL